MRLIRNLAALAQEADLTPAQLALHWVLRQGEHVHAIPGTTSIAHLEDNHAAATLPVAEEIVTEAGVIINQLTVRGHRYSDAIRPTIDTEEFGETQAADA
jgi:aryl-alcohol dehydrogenase-like predicted oxidoreductase